MRVDSFAQISERSWEHAVIACLVVDFMRASHLL
jgi:hypothetical protein